MTAINLFLPIETAEIGHGPNKLQGPLVPRT